MKKIYVGILGILKRFFLRINPELFTFSSFEKSPKHFIISLLAIHDVERMVQLKSPWWTYAAISRTNNYLNKKNAESQGKVRAFEWGSGASTILIQNQVDELVSVEYDRDFYRFLRPFMHQQVNLILSKPEKDSHSSIQIQSSKKGHKGLDFSKYVEVINNYPDGYFNLIIIDGRAREHCLSRAIEKLSEDGIIVFDDMYRSRYRTAVKGLSRYKRVRVEKYFGLTPTLPYPSSTWVITKSRV